MTDVRLTATNPEDSSVVYVACNAKGEMLLEEPIAFDGNLDGDLTVSGSGRFDGEITIGEFNATNNTDAFGSSIWKYGGDDADSRTTLQLQSKGTATNGAAFIVNKGSSQQIVFEYDGSADFAGGDITLSATGNGKFSGNVTVDSYVAANSDGIRKGVSSTFLSYGDSGFAGGATAYISANGTAKFSGDVTVGSRGKSWMLVEQGGLCHLVEQTRFDADQIDEGFSVNEYPKLRDVFNELDLVEQALNTVMEKLRLTPPAGWEVWDGSDNP